MLALAVAVLCTTAFSLLIRHTQRTGQDQFAVMAVNYLSASVIGFAMAGRPLHASTATWHIGLIGGVTFVLTYLVLIQSMDLKGVAIANAITRLSVIIPMLATILIWGEHPQFLEGLGALLALTAMPLLSLDRDGHGKRLTRRQVPLLLALFVTNGCCLLTSKWFHASGLTAERSLYFGILFGTAAIVSVVCWLGWSRRCSWREFASGIPLGAINIATGLAVIYALDTLSGSVVFPVFAALGLALTTGFAAWVWHESPGKLGKIGIGVALAAVVLVNLRF